MVEKTVGEGQQGNTGQQCRQIGYQRLAINQLGRPDRKQTQICDGTGEQGTVEQGKPYMAVAQGVSETQQVVDRQ